MKRKLTALAAMALCVTIGGVYATWTYAENSAKALENQSIEVSITTATKISKGEIKLVSNNLELIIGNDGSYNTELRVEGTITVEFVPAENATETINAQYQLSTSENWKYNGQDIFSVSSNAVTNTLTEGDTWTVNAEDLGITLNSFNLATYEEYEAFASALGEGAITITFSEVV